MSWRIRFGRRSLLPDRFAVFHGFRAFVAAVGTFATLAVLARWVHASSGVLVLGVVIAFSLDRVSRGGAGWKSPLVILGLPAVTACVAVVGALMLVSPLAGSALFVVLVFVSIHLRRYGHAASAFGRLMALPLLGLFMAPVPVGGDPLAALGWSAVAALVAVAWNGVAAVAMARLRPRPAPPGDGTTAVPLPSPSPSPSPLSSSAAASGSVHTRLAAQSALALALAFTAGHLLFPAHWPWTVVTALVVTIGARSRGHVLHKGAQRFAGALAGAGTATLIAGPVTGHPVAAVVGIFAYLLVGLILRQVDYAYWSFCMTSMLALLYGLLGQAGPAFLGGRLLQIVLGTVCAVLPAFVLLPIRTEAVVRRNLSRTLEALGDLLQGPPDQEKRARFDEQAAALKIAAEPLVALRRVLRPLVPVLPAHRTRPGLAECAEDLAACGDPVATLTAPPPPRSFSTPSVTAAPVIPPAAAEPGPSSGPSHRAARIALRRNIGAIRLTLGRRPAPAWVPVELAPLDQEQPAGQGADPVLRALVELEGRLRSVHATLTAGHGASGIPGAAAAADAPAAAPR
ncbi:FUSC family protein [Sphaerisporangium sp. NPDC005288]|uniref:FUSC family protein n=1 Tax=Sphaerisporangium sp. NPDC005288 TaxID=3155114 RepID=UPI0033A7C716